MLKDIAFRVPIIIKLGTTAGVMVDKDVLFTVNDTVHLLGLSMIQEKKK